MKETDRQIVNHIRIMIEETDFSNTNPMVKECLLKVL